MRIYTFLITKDFGVRGGLARHASHCYTHTAYPRLEEWDPTPPGGIKKQTIVIADAREVNLLNRLDRY